MKIGIDIDNTLTEVQEKLNEAAYTYAVSLGKNLEGYDKLMKDEKMMVLNTQKDFSLTMKN